jgi:hypothetical protein
MHCEKLAVRVVVGKCLCEFVSKGVRVGCCRKGLEKLNDFLPAKKFAGVFVKEMCPPLSDVFLKRLHEVSHCSFLSIGIKAPRIRCLVTVRGAEIMGALR